MRVRVLGVKEIKGVSSKSGEPFEIVNVLCMVPVENNKGKTLSVRGHGFDIAELRLDAVAIDQFAGLNYPAELELQVEQRFNRGEFQSICVGVTQAAKVAKVA